MKKELVSKDAPKLEIIVPKLNLGIIKIQIKGKTPLLMDRFPESVREQILDKQVGLTKGKKQLRDMDWEFENAFHKLPNGKIGFPAQGFKSAMIESTSFVGSSTSSKPKVG